MTTLTPQKMQTIERLHHQDTTVLMQDDTWTTRDGRELALADIDGDHARCIIELLTRQARHLQISAVNRAAGEAHVLKMGVDLAGNIIPGDYSDSHASLHADSVAWGIAMQDPQQWLASTPLMKALAARAA